MLEEKKVLLVITGGIAAYKSLELIRLLQISKASVVPVMTQSAQQFLKPLSVAAIAGSKVYTELFDLTAEAEMGHIELSRSADIILVAPASADFLSKMAQGICDDLATTILLATDTPVLVAPSMNVRMWHHPATQRNMHAINSDGISTIGPNEGDMACGEFGHGRMAEPAEIVTFLHNYFKVGPLSGKRIIVTSGTTHEMIDPIRYIANRSSGAQGTAIASALAALGASVILVTGPSKTPSPPNVKLIEVQTGREMYKAVLDELPADVAVFVAAVGDWYVGEVAEQKIKKNNGNPPSLKFQENPDILHEVSNLREKRPSLVIGFAAETSDLIKNAEIKLNKKNCDWIIANDVSTATGIMGGDQNKITLISEKQKEDWPLMSKTLVATKLAAKICESLGV
jgi:phosphopantothenoylcysteine decarboxylase / phosphopantothenate---cysteine ligase